MSKCAMIASWLGSQNTPPPLPPASSDELETERGGARGGHLLESSISSKRPLEDKYSKPLTVEMGGAGGGHLLEFSALLLEWKPLAVEMGGAEGGGHLLELPSLLGARFCNRLPMLLAVKRGGADGGHLLEL